ncbi:hypothetical protein KKF34_17240 [Myxococcota bacterium]|nr:hypothetical protein [Myxococcota bacterium]MBU1381091.1 hypothetical protein [Myxococcota bacterium]MBU1498626.1 hypothetical protein [Myxococcota bacterium]
MKSTTLILFATMIFLFPLRANSSDLSFFYRNNLLFNYGTTDSVGFAYGAYGNLFRKSFTGVMYSGIFNYTEGNMTGLQVSPFNYVQGDFTGVQLNTLVGLVDGNANGLQLSVFISYAGGNFDGFQIAGFMSHTMGNFDGIQAAIVNITEGSFSGLQLSPVFNIVGKNSSGVQFSFGVNGAEGKFTGLQFSFIVNFADSIKGVQFGYVNKAGEVTGVQAGSYNYVSKLNGLQVGFGNLARSGNGLQIGFANISNDYKGYAVSPIIFNLKEFIDLEAGWTSFAKPYGGIISGTEKSYTMLTYSPSLKDDDEGAFGVHYGIRHRDKTWMFESDIGYVWNTAENGRYRGFSAIRFRLHHRFTEHWSFFAGMELLRIFEGENSGPRWFMGVRLQ